MLTKVVNKIRHLLNSGHKNPVTVTYPYTYQQNEYNLSFNINNPIEEFRLKNWGGEKDYVISMMNALKEDDILYDIGSSVGLVSVIAAKVLNKGKVISFEPDPENIIRLKENYTINNLNNYQVQSMAVGEAKSNMKLYTAGSNGYSPSLQKVNGINSFIEVEVNSIDDLLANKQVPYPTVVKIDIEGAEMMALKGMEKLLKDKRKPRLIFIEIHPDFLPSFGTSAETILEYLAQFDFSIEEQIQRDKQILCKLVRKD